MEGKLQVRAYKGKDGQMRIAAEVIADNMQMLGSKKRDESEPALEKPVEDAEKAPF